MKLSILICSLSERLTKLSTLIEMLEKQAKDKQVEVLWLGDNRQMTVGEKRNKLLQLAKGDYVSFIDDDDMVAENYIEELLQAMRKKPDVICFECLYANAQTGIKNHVYFGRKHLNENMDAQGIRYRMPNHLCAIKREIALQAKFNEKNFGEDSDFAMTLRNKFLLHTEVVIPKILYSYQFNPKTFATWQFAPSNHKPSAISHKPSAMIDMDVVIVSDGTSKDLRLMTQECIHTFQSAHSNIIVPEKNDKIKYLHADTLTQPGPFNYNACLNDGAAMGNAEFICFSNNDIGVHEHFVENAIKEMNLKKLDVGGIKDQRGYSPNDCITGWCFIMRRNAWIKIGRLNEDYAFYCSDNIVWKQIKEHGLKYEVLHSVNCHHGISVTKARLDAATMSDYTVGCVKKFNREHKENLLNMGT